MRIVKVRDCYGREVRMVAVHESERLVYVANPASTARIEAGLTEAVGVLREDVTFLDI